MQGTETALTQMPDHTAARIPDRHKGWTDFLKTTARSVGEHWRERYTAIRDFHSRWFLALYKSI
ncbi:MAG: hypothetical protein VB055_02150 [Oscillospiraceae bacterium]|nr:hypothetical protein [Oscillospiraceae bacterium]